MSKRDDKCPRCGGEPEDMMASKLERGKHVCFLCAEDEVCRPGYVRRKYLDSIDDIDNQETTTRIRQRSRQRIRPMLTRQSIEGLKLKIDNTKIRQGSPKRIHLSHPACPSVSSCSFERYSASVLTADPLKVTCGHCLRTLRKPEDGSK